MKKLSLVSLLLLLMLVGCKTVKAPRDEQKTIVKEVTNEDLNLTYQQLKDKTDLIVLVEVEDKVTLENSYIKDDQYLSHRSLKVLSVFKEKTDLKKTSSENKNRPERHLLLEEPVAIDGHALYHYSNHEPLRFGGKYVLFLKQTDLKEVVTLAATDRGVLCVDDWMINKNVDIFANFIFEYLKPTYNNQLIEYSPLTLVTEEKTNLVPKTIKVETEYLTLPVRVSYDSVKNHDIVQIFNYTFEAKPNSIMKYIK